MHFGQRTNISGTLRTITDFGEYGVQLFFIISGFLAAKGLSKRKINIGTYYLKRAIHILPLYFFSIIWFFVSENLLNLYLKQIPEDSAGLGWLRYVFFLNGFINSDTYFWRNLGITWTIPIFVFFYLIAPFVIKCIKNLKSACLIFILSVAFSEIVSKIYKCTIISNLWILLLGILVYYAIENNKALEFSALFQTVSIVTVIMGNRKLSYIFLFAGIITSVVTIDKKIQLPIVFQRIVNYIDERTYTLYLVHGIVFCSLIDRLYIFKLPFWLVGIIAIIFSALGTVIVHKFYEKPIQKWLTNVLINNELRNNG